MPEPVYFHCAAVTPVSGCKHFLFPCNLYISSCQNWWVTIVKVAEGVTMWNREMESSRLVSYKAMPSATPLAFRCHLVCCPIPWLLPHQSSWYHLSLGGSCLLDCSSPGGGNCGSSLVTWLGHCPGLSWELAIHYALHKNLGFFLCLLSYLEHLFKLTEYRQKVLFHVTCTIKSCFSLVPDTCPRFVSYSLNEVPELAHAQLPLKVFWSLASLRVFPEWNECCTHVKESFCGWKGFLWAQHSFCLQMKLLLMEL